jgi:prephenate dehydrogenase
MAELCFQRIAIVGLGLMGGSWGLALKRQAYDGVLAGCDRPSILKSALAAGAIDIAEEDPLVAVSRADLVILAPPVGVILDLLPHLKTALAPAALVTDVGSTKVEICQRARETFGDAILFLGGHPLAGKERSGIEHAEATLFENTAYALAPQASADLEDARVKAFIRLVSSVGARPFITDALSHDRAAAYLSHLPQLVSTSLAGVIAERHSQDRLPLDMAAAGLWDMTRLAESPYPVWRDICRTNTTNIQDALDGLIEKLQTLRQRLSSDSLQNDFDQAGKLRERLRKDNRE